MKFEINNIYVENITFIIFLGAFVIGNYSFYLKGKGLSSSYTRKINHFGLSLTSIIAFSNIPIEDTTKNAIISSLLILIVYTLSAISKYRWINAIMESNIRERDMPNGKFFVFLPLITGQIALYISLIYLNPIFTKIAFCSMGFGDGLAEPIGVRFGKHKYKIRDFLWKKENTKSIEGSLAVFLVSFFASLILITMNYKISFIEIIIISFIYSFLISIIEAFSPRGLDNFLIILGGSSILYILMFFY